MARQPAYEPEPGPEYVDEHHQRISEFANDYFDDDDERETFVGTLMERRGYRRVQSWGPPDQDQQEPEPGPEPEPQQRQRRPAQPKRPPYFKQTR